MSGRAGQRGQCWELRWGHMAKSADLAREETRAKSALGQKTVLSVAVRREGEELEPVSASTTAGPLLDSFMGSFQQSRAALVVMLKR